MGGLGAGEAKGGKGDNGREKRERGKGIKVYRRRIDWKRGGKTY